jgi:hypothetical protein
MKNWLVCAASATIYTDGDDALAIKVMLQGLPMPFPEKDLFIIVNNLHGLSTISAVISY